MKSACSHHWQLAAGKSWGTSSKQYTGKISGFGANTTQSIDLTDINFATVSKTFAGGILTLKDGSGDVAHLKISGTHALASFHLANDGNGGVLITDPPTPHATSATQAATGRANGFALPSMPQISQLVQAMGSFGQASGLDASPPANLQSASSWAYQNISWRRRLIISTCKASEVMFWRRPVISAKWLSENICLNLDRHRKDPAGSPPARGVKMW